MGPFTGDLARFCAPGDFFGGCGRIGPGHRRKWCRARQHAPGGRLRPGRGTWERPCVVGQAPGTLSGTRQPVDERSRGRSGTSGRQAWPHIGHFRRTRDLGSTSTSAHDIVGLLYNYAAYFNTKYTKIHIYKHRMGFWGFGVVLFFNLAQGCLYLFVGVEAHFVDQVV